MSAIVFASSADSQLGYDIHRRKIWDVFKFKMAAIGIDYQSFSCFWPQMQRRRR